MVDWFKSLATKQTIPANIKIITEPASKITTKITSQASKPVTDLLLPSKLPRGFGRGALFQDSAYAGTGQYELTSETISPRVDSISSYSISGIQEPQVGVGIDSVLYSGLGIGLGLGMESIQLQKQSQQLERKSIQEPLSISKVIQKSLLDTRIIQQLKSSQQLKTEQISKTEQVSKTTQIVKPTTITRRPRTTPEPRPPKIPIPFIFPDDPKKKRRLIKKRPTKEPEFLAITKRYGKEIVIAKGKDLTKIIAKGKKRVLGTLGATLKVKTVKGKQIKLTPDKIFRAGKTDPLAIVQKRGERLSALGERKEIKQTRKKRFNLLWTKKI